VRSYLVDEVSRQDKEKIIEFLKQNAVRSELGDIFWVQIPVDLLSDIQIQHRECQPHAFAIELGRDWIKLEFFIRSLKGMRCECQAYALSQQRNFILDFAHGMIEELGIST
jgi:hypothetical protein